MAQILPIAALGAQKRSTEALKGDIYTRSWTSVQGKGKKKKVVEHELHVNPITLVVVGVGAAVAAFAGMVALHGVGKKAGLNVEKTIRRIVDEYQPVYEDVKVVDSLARSVPYTVPGYYKDDRVWNPLTHQYEYITVWVPESTGYTDEAEVSHTEQRTVSAYRVVVMSNNFVPHGSYKDLTEALQKMQSRYKMPPSEQGGYNLTENTAVAQWVKVGGRDVRRHFYQFRAIGVGVGDLEPGDSWTKHSKLPWPLGPL